MDSDDESHDVTPPKRSKRNENWKTQLNVLNDVLQRLSLATLDLSTCEEGQREIRIRDCAKSVHDKILENFHIPSNDFETLASYSSVASTFSQRSHSMSTVHSWSRKGTANSAEEGTVQNKDEIIVRVLQREKRLMKSRNHWFTFFLCKMPNNLLVEAYSYNQNDYKTLKAGHTYNVTSGFYKKAKNIKFSARSKTEISWEFYLSEVAVKETGEFAIVDHGEEFFPSEATTIVNLTAMNQMDPPYEYKYRLVKDVILKSGILYRYVGCKFCAKSLIHANENDGIYKCISCKTQGPPGKMFKNFMIIRDLTIEDSNGQNLPGIICFNSIVEILLGKKSEEIEVDDDADSIFEKLLGSIVNMRLSCVPSRYQFNARGYDIVANYIRITCPQVILKADDQGKENFVVDADPTPAAPVVKGLNARVSGEFNFEISQEEVQVDSLPSKAIYKLKTKPSGYALIINISRYFNDDDREGSKQDVIKLTGVLKNLNFKVFGNDPDREYSYADIFLKIDGFKRRLRRKKISACLVAVMGHGEFDTIKSSEGFHINVETIIDQFSQEKFPQYSLEPKIFIFGMCRTNPKERASSFDEDDIGNRKFPNIENAYFCYPCPSGYYSARTVSKGTIFIDRIVQGLRDYAKRLDLKTILDEVQHKMIEDKQPFSLVHSDGTEENTTLMPLEHFGQVFRKFFFRVARNNEERFDSELDYLHETLPTVA